MNYTQLGEVWDEEAELAKVPVSDVLQNLVHMTNAFLERIKNVFKPGSTQISYAAYQIIERDYKELSSTVNFALNYFNTHRRGVLQKYPTSYNKIQGNLSQINAILKRIEGLPVLVEVGQLPSPPTSDSESPPPSPSPSDSDLPPGTEVVDLSKSKSKFPVGIALAAGALAFLTLKN